MQFHDSGEFGDLFLDDRWQLYGIIVRTNGLENTRVVFEFLSSSRIVSRCEKMSTIEHRYPLFGGRIVAPALKKACAATALGGIGSKYSVDGVTPTLSYSSKERLLSSCFVCRKSNAVLRGWTQWNRIAAKIVHCREDVCSLLRIADPPINCCKCHTTKGKRVGKALGILHESDEHIYNKKRSRKPLVVQTERWDQADGPQVDCEATMKGCV